MKEKNNNFSKILFDENSLEHSDNIIAMQQIKNQIAMRLFEEWMADESGYDEKIWESVKKSIENNRLSIRRKFNA